MFDEFRRELDRLEQGIRLPVDLPVDASGYIDRECPAKQCLFAFKVNAEDWQALFSDDAVYCPLCGHRAPSSHWWTTAQAEHASELGRRHVLSVLTGALREDSRGFARRVRTPLLSFNMAMTVSVPLGWLPLPAPIADALAQDLRCDACGARYAILGCAFFCPCCGKSSARKLFDGALRRIEAAVSTAAAPQAPTADVAERDQAAQVRTYVLEHALSEYVGAFEALCKDLFSRSWPTVQLPRNVFQRIAQGAELWERHAGIRYGEILGSERLERLRLHFERRHLLVHAAGVVDAEYIAKTGDETYSTGQRIVVSVGDVKEMGELLQTLATALLAAVPAERATSHRNSTISLTEAPASPPPSNHQGDEHRPSA